MSKAETVSAALDERKGRVLVTYRACKGVVVRAGVLAQLQHRGKSAEDVAASVHEAIKEFCYVRQMHPCLNAIKGRRGQVDRKLLSQIVSHVEMLSADGAESEQLGMRMLHPQSQASDYCRG